MLQKISLACVLTCLLTSSALALPQDFSDSDQLDDLALFNPTDGSFVIRNSPDYLDLGFGVQIFGGTVRYCCELRQR